MTLIFKSRMRGHYLSALAMCLAVGATTPTTAQAAAPQDDNTAQFSWNTDKTSLTVTGKGDLSQVTVTDDNTKVFTAKAAGKVYTKSGEASTAVAEGDKYDSSASYYEATINYTSIECKVDYTNISSVTTTYIKTLSEGQKIYTCWYTKENNKISKVTLGSESDLSYISNWGHDANSGDYYYYCVVTGTITTNQAYDISSLSGEGYSITLLTDQNVGTYVTVTTTVTPVSGKTLYTKEANSEDYIQRTSAWTYTTGQTIYTGAVTVSETAIADNNTYFTSTHSDYLSGWSGTLAEYIPYAVGSTVKSVTFLSEDSKNKATINNAITRALVKCSSITMLNLKHVEIDALTVRKAGDPSDDATFSPNVPASWTTTANTTLETLYTPTVKNTTTLPQGVFFELSGLKELHLSSGIETLDEKCLDVTEQTNKFALTNVYMPNTLTTIKANAFNGQTGILTFMIPASVTSIETKAFTGTNAKDVYFLGTKAPKVAKDAWDDKSYISDNNVPQDKVEDGETGSTVTVSLTDGVACRGNYAYNNSGTNNWMTMMHYPSTCTQAEAARYTDLTREYKKIVYDENNSETIDGTSYTVYRPGKETTDLKGSTAMTSNVTADKYFYNRFQQGFAKGSYTGGYDDAYIGSQYQWPSWNMSTRASIVAQNGLLWDGTTKIGEGIKKYEESYTGDGTEYEGLHQFALVKADANATSDEGWSMEKYADGNWHTICLPFSLTKAELESIFGNKDFSLCKFSYVKRYVGVDGYSDQITLCFNVDVYAKAESEDEVVLKAHTAYMIKAAATENAIAIEDFELEEGDPTPTAVTVETEPGIAQGELYSYYFIGNYLSGIKIPQHSYFFSKSKKKFNFQTGTNGNWNPYTAVVLTVNGDEDNTKFFTTSSGDNSGAKLMTLLGEDNDGGVVTDIKGLTLIANDELVYTDAKVYDLNGRLVSDKGIKNLAKGIYVVNGKKVAVK